MASLGYWYFLKMGGSKEEGVDGVLLAPDGRYWQARSGPKGKGALPDGIWRIGGVRTRGLSYHFRDGAGNYWVCGLYSQGIRISRRRWNFAIHPDGSTPRGGVWRGPDGTFGCIGLTEYDTSGARRALARARKSLLIAKPEQMSDEELFRTAIRG